MGQPGDSCLVDGLVCRRKLAHKRMPSRVKQPRIMMLASTLEYHRTQHKLSSFDTLLQQASLVPVSRHLLCQLHEPQQNTYAGTTCGEHCEVDLCTTEQPGRNNCDLYKCQCNLALCAQATSSLLHHTDIILVPSAAYFDMI